MIRTIGSGPDLRSILSGVVELATEATKCHACLIWFLEGERLVMRASSEPYSSLAGELSVALGEGLVGWVAGNRRSAFIEQDALDDPRVRYFPELEEERFQSLVSVPMFVRGGEVMGVISLHAEAPHEFDSDDLDFLEHTAALIAGAVENARLYEDSTARVGLLTDLSNLSRSIASAGGIEELLGVVCAGTRDLLSAQTCEIYLADPDGQLALAAADPPRERSAVHPGAISSAGPRSAGAWGGRRLARALWRDPPDGTALVEPLSVGDEDLGLLAVLTPSPPPGAETALSAIAAHTAVAIRRHELVERLLEKNLVSEFFAALSAPAGDPERARRLAARIGVDLGEAHAVVIVTAWPTPTDPVDRDPAASTVLNEGVSRLESAVASSLPGVPFDRNERSVRMLVPVTEDSARIRRTVEGFLDSAGASWTAGISDPRRYPASFAASFEEAAAAAEIGALLRRGPGVAEFRDLGAYRYVMSPPALVPELDRRRLERLVAYDGRRGTALLDTLERFLDERGNVVGTARALYIHPNTLRQRLERVEQESGIDLARDDWLSLAIAVKVVKLGRMRSASSDWGESHG